MESAVPLSSIVVGALLPPASLAWLALAALLMPLRFRPRLVAGLLLGALLVLGMPAVSAALIGSLETVPPPLAADTKPGAIVVLSAEVERVAGPERLQVGPMTLARERAGAALARRTGLPVLVTGGILDGPPAVGTLMADSMEKDFGVPVRWTEARSGTTWENARFSAPLLKAAGIGTVYLVTDAWHMPRSLLAFRRAGLEAVPAPVRVRPPVSLRLGDLVPRASGWAVSYYAIHEWVGLLAYALRP